MQEDKKLRWKDAVLEVLHQNNGATTLATLYAETPKFIAKSKSEDYTHDIRGYLTRLKKENKIKQIGLSTYALKDFEPTNNIYEEILNEKVTQKSFIALTETTMHGHLQGMLIEIGNMQGYDTYTPDKNVVFNGKSLSEVASMKVIPEFTYSKAVKKIAQIDVIWFKEGYPVKTFDVEHSTDFTKALVRSYQLKYFTAKCFMVADKKKQKLFEDRITTKPFDELQDGVELLFNSDVFDGYKNMLKIATLQKESHLL